MLEKNKIIHNKGDKISLRNRTGPIEKLMAVRVVIANRNMAFTAYRERNSICRSFKKTT
jgi:hypothetical protein